MRQRTSKQDIMIARIGEKKALWLGMLDGEPCYTDQAALMRAKAAVSRVRELSESSIDVAPLEYVTADWRKTNAKRQSGVTSCRRSGMLHTIAAPCRTLPLAR